MFADTERGGEVFTGGEAGFVISGGIVIETGDRTAVRLEGAGEEGGREI